MGSLQKEEKDFVKVLGLVSGGDYGGGNGDWGWGQGCHSSVPDG